MSENEYISKLKVRKCPMFDAGPINISPELLEEQLRSAFKAGQIEGMEKALPFQNQDPSLSLFERVFGKYHDR